jgi:hypothetical protein
MTILISFGRLDSAVCIPYLIDVRYCSFGVPIIPLSFLGNISFSIWTWHSVVVYIQFILKYLTLFLRPSIPYPHHPYQLSPAFVYGRSRRTRSYTANSSSLISLLFFPPSLSLYPSLFQVRYNIRIRQNVYGGG